MSISFPKAVPLTLHQQQPEIKAQIIEAFELCKQHLWSGVGPQGTKYEGPICYALAATRHPGYIEAQRIIVSRLQPYGVAMLTKYLNQQGYAGDDLEVYQACRLAWVNKLIAELKA